MRNSLEKNEQASTELNFSLLKICLCLTLILSFNLKHIPSNKAVKHDVWGTMSSAWKHRKAMEKHCGQINLSVSDDSACDQATFVKNRTGLAGSICHFLKS